MLLGLSLSLASPANSQEFRTIDPSGVWKGLHGVLCLMLTGDALSFSYSAVFGATAHLCDGVGVAGLVADGEYHYVDEQGTVAFIVSEQGVKMRTVKGIVSFCGANWPGDEFTKGGYEALKRCTVSDKKAHFHVVMRTPPLSAKPMCSRVTGLTWSQPVSMGGMPGFWPASRGAKLPLWDCSRKMPWSVWTKTSLNRD